VASDLKSQFATVLVGADQEAFYAHKALLCKRCPFFEKALGGGTKEAEENIVTMTAEDPATVTQFLSWLYRDDIFEENIHSKTSISQASYDRLAKLWVFGDKLCIPDLQDLVMSKLVEVYKGKQERGKLAIAPFVVDPVVLHYVYDHTVPLSPLRRFFVDSIAYGSAIEWYKKNKVGFPVDLVVDVSFTWMKIAKTSNSSAAPNKAPFLTKTDAFYVSNLPLKLEATFAGSTTSWERKASTNDEDIMIIEI
jgi:hypothetical protein